LVSQASLNPSPSLSGAGQDAAANSHTESAQAALSTAVQVPVTQLAALHPSLGEHEARLQHTLSTQWPLAHVLPAEHAAPSCFLSTQEASTQTPASPQSLSAAQIVSHAPASQSLSH
jgi:hypothetical protein